MDTISNSAETIATVSALTAWNQFDGASDLEQEFKNKIHLRVQKRNNKKCVTIIEGLKGVVVLTNAPEIGDFLRRCRQVLCCNGNLDEEEGVIILQGDHRVALMDLLGKYYGLKGEQIVIHGY